MESHQALPRLSPTVPPPLAPLGLPRFPRAEPMVTSIPPRDVFVPRPPPNLGVRASHLLNDSNKVKQKGEMLNGIMPRHQEPAGTRTPPAPQVPAAASTPTRLPPREQLRQRSTGEVTPLRKPLPPEGPLPMKPRRPPVVNLEPFLRSARKVPPLPGPRRSDGESVSRGLPMLIWLLEFSLRKICLLTITWKWQQIELEDKVGPPRPFI